MKTYQIKTKKNITNITTNIDINSLIVEQAEEHLIGNSIGSDRDAQDHDIKLGYNLYKIDGDLTATVVLTDRNNTTIEILAL